MTNPLSFDELQTIFHQGIAHLPDYRKDSPNTRYTMQDAALGAFGIFFMQSPSFLEYQRQLQASKGRNNAQTLLSVQTIPCDNQIRTLLDPRAPQRTRERYGRSDAGLSDRGGCGCGGNRGWSGGWGRSGRYCVAVWVGSVVG